MEGKADKNLVYRDLSEFFPSLTYGILIKKGKIINPLLQRFIDTLQEENYLEKYGEKISYDISTA